MNKAVKEFADHYKILDALILAEVPPVLADDEITVPRVRDRYNIAHKTALRSIKTLEAAGKIVYAGKRRNGSRTVDAWRLA